MEGRLLLTTQKRLIDYLLPHAERQIVNDVRIGLGYTAVKLSSGHAGVAWTPKASSSGCSHFDKAGTLAGSPAKELVTLFGDETSDLARAIGLATANALLASLPKPPFLPQEIIDSLQITADDRVAMVGYFGPIIPQLRKIGCRLDILELNDEHMDTLPPGQTATVLAGCTLAIITGTSLINGTFGKLLASLGKPRAAVLLGPSTPLCGEIFQDTKITHVAGARVRDAEAVLRITSEGGGTMQMKKYMDFETMLTRQDS